MKRANGTGSIVRMHGNRRRPYAVRVSVPDPDDDRRVRQKYVGWFPTVTEAQAFLDQYNREEIRTLGTTLYDMWVGYQGSRKFTELSDNSQKTYRISWNHLAPLAGRSMATIRRSELQKIIDDAEADGKAPATLQRIKVLMGILFRRAMEDDIIQKDPSQFVETPKLVAVKTKDVLTPETIAELWRRKEDPFIQSALVLTYTGFRINELLKLTAESYHPDPVPHLIGGSKTAAGIDRPVPVHPCIQPIIEARLEKKGRLFDEYKSAGSYERAFKTLMTQLGQPEATPHWCRYTLTSMLEMAGANRLATDRITGHANKGITDHYTKLTIEYLYEQMCLIEV